jgi:hypothetical protein
MSGRLALSASFVRNSLFVGMVGLSVASVLFTGRLAGRLERQTATFTDLFARFAAVSTLPASEDDEAQRVFRGFLDRVTFPIIVTDQRGVPLTCKGTAISPDAITYELFTTTDPQNPPPGPMEQLLRLARDMDGRRTPIPIVRPQTGELFGHIHYGPSPLVAQLRAMPYIQILIAALLVGFGYLGIRSVRTSEKRSIWVGMARETAHQLGTPISSGWAG